MKLDHSYVPEPHGRDTCDARVENGSGHVTQCGRGVFEHPVLVCSSCRVKPTPEEAKWTARLGGTHYKRVAHAVGIPGNRGVTNARSCGKWVVEVERAA